MGLIQVGWVAKPDPEPAEFLVNMTDPQFLKVEAILKSAVSMPESIVIDSLF